MMVSSAEDAQPAPRETLPQHRRGPCRPLDRPDSESARGAKQGRATASRNGVTIATRMATAIALGVAGRPAIALNLKPGPGRAGPDPGSGDWRVGTRTGRA